MVNALLMLQTTEKSILMAEDEEENEEVILESNETKNEINMNNVTDMVENQLNIWSSNSNVSTL